MQFKLLGFSCRNSTCINKSSHIKRDRSSANRVRSLLLRTPPEFLRTIGSMRNRINAYRYIIWNSYCWTRAFWASVFSSMKWEGSMGSLVFESHNYWVIFWQPTLWIANIQNPFVVALEFVSWPFKSLSPFQVRQISGNDLQMSFCPCKDLLYYLKQRQALCASPPFATYATAVLLSFKASRLALSRSWLASDNPPGLRLLTHARGLPQWSK